MAGWDLSVDELLATARILAFEPSTGGRFTNPELLRVANLLNLTYTYPLLRRISEEYYITKYDQSPVASQSEYEIPSDAYGATLRDVTWIDASGNGYSMTWFPVEDIDFFAAGNVADQVPACTIEGRNVVLLPAPSSSAGTLRMRFQRRPNKMVLSEEAAQITGISGTTYSADVPAGWDTGDSFCLVRGDGTFDTLVTSFTASAVTAATSVVSANTDLASRAAVGDWIALRDETPIPQLPEPMHLLLARRLAHEMLLATGDVRAASVFAALEVDEKNAVLTLSPRNKGEVFRIVNWMSHLRSGSKRGYFTTGRVA